MAVKQPIRLGIRSAQAGLLVNTILTGVKLVAGIVGNSGAPGIVYSVELLRVLKLVGIETHLVVSTAGEQTRALETSLSA